MDKATYIQRGFRVVFAVAALGAVWLVVLPWVGEWGGVREHIRRMEEGGVDPSAMYYSELAGLEEAEATFRRLAEEDPELLWRR
ncbi:MAG: hypothetical protein KDA68_13270 [Planctomycetaceae bacterium]|nr:hypothetical protein [Planctomycetaceae bacterium]